MTEEVKKNRNYELIEEFDKNSEYSDSRISRDIENNRKGYFSLRFTDAENKRIYPDTVTVKQKSHEFKFGCSLFLLEQFDTDEKNRLYKEAFKKIFGCGVAPIYWDTLEPERGKPRFSEDSPNIWRRPALDTVVKFCKENGIRMKAHCLAYNSFNPSWLPESNREIKIELERRTAELGARYRYDFEDMDVINEMYSVYKNCYFGSGNGMRTLKIVDEYDHERFCFDLAKKEFPETRLFWNEGCFESFGNEAYVGPRSRYYLMLKRQLEMGTKIEGIGMQFHAFAGNNASKYLYNPLRAMDIFDCYSDFRLPVHLSEVSVPSWSNEATDEEIQGELVERMLKVWFSRRYCDAVIWWNLVDGTAYGDENVFHAGLLRNDFSPKPAYETFDRLINKEWHTEFTASGKGEKFTFGGFYGNYDITFTYGGKEYTRTLRLFRDNTGYDNRLSDFRFSDIHI